MSNLPSAVRVSIGLLLVLSHQILAAAGEGRVLGVLKDPGGAIMQGARVEIKGLDSNLAQSIRTDLQGRYTFDALPAGRYQVSAAAPGFQTVTQGEVRVIAEKESVADLVLGIARTKTVVVVTAPAMSRPLLVETDPRAPRQPIPANDGADYLKAIPGFSIIRKGGTDGDPVLRGMAGSRLPVLLDGQQILGGCGGRMDPPTAYIFPSAFDRVIVVKGPQSVQYGPDASAGVVLFERGFRRVERAGVKADSSLTVGGYGRHDEMMEAQAALPSAYVRAFATRSHSGDYRDGGGSAVHSSYTRWNSNLALGWTPSENTRLELSLAGSNGRAAYADRTMDGIKFARNNVAIRFERQGLAHWLPKIEAQSYYNYVDHVMDNFSLRTPGTSFSVNNPDRRTMGGRFAATLLLAEPTTLILGADTQRNRHRMRNASALSSADLAKTTYLSAPRGEDMRFNQAGFFAEGTHNLAPQTRLIGGFRTDWHEAIDDRACVGVAMCPGASPLKNDTRGAVDRKWLKNAFGRIERDILAGGLATLYAGVGHAERFPDYWERLRQDPAMLKSAFLSTRPEKTTQLDVGMLWKNEEWSGSVSGFYGKVRDYILIKWSPTPSVSRNVNANTMGAEADISRRLTRNLKADATLAFVHANNETDRKPLAQQPPLEGRLGLYYESRTYSLGGLARLVGRQNRIDIGSGNIVANGMDLGPSAGFAVFSINAGYRLKGRLLITGGIDNLFDKTYAEHLSRGGAMVPGFVAQRQINEPGRMFWLKLNFDVE